MSYFLLGFPDNSVGKEPTCNAEDSGLIPGSGSSPGEGIDYPLQYSWASFVAQMVKNLPAMQETWIRSLGWEDSPGEEKGYPLQYSGLENSTDCLVHGSRRVGHNWDAFTFTFCYQIFKYLIVQTSNTFKFQRNNCQNTLTGKMHKHKPECDLNQICS